MLYLPVIGVLSATDELLRPLVTGVKGVDAFLGADEPNPTGVGLTGVRPPERIDDDLLMLLPRGDESSEFRERLDPVRDGGRDPPRLPGWAEARL